MASADSFLLEICVDNVESIRNAIEGGANRLELCSALAVGGLTPSLGLAKLAKRVAPVPVFAMLRLRGGSFVYAQEEIDATLHDLKAFKEAGIDGFVFGALTSDNRLDVASCKRIIEAASPLPVTFHRAFDETKDPLASLDAIVELGFARILTSGQEKTAIEGAELIKELVERADGRIVVMPGAGVNGKNIVSLRDRTGAKEFHGSAKRETTGLSLGGLAHAKLDVTDEDNVSTLLGLLRS